MDKKTKILRKSVKCSSNLHSDDFLHFNNTVDWIALNFCFSALLSSWSACFIDVGKLKT